MNLVLVIVGVVIGCSASIYGGRHPRLKGQPLEKSRKIAAAVAFLGLVLVLWGGALTLLQ
jgi:uncharacterized membrane protein